MKKGSSKKGTGKGSNKRFDKHEEYSEKFDRPERSPQQRYQFLKLEDILGPSWPKNERGYPDLSIRAQLENRKLVIDHFENSRVVVSEKTPSIILVQLRENCKQTETQLQMKLENDLTDILTIENIMPDTWPKEDGRRFKLDPQTMAQHGSSISVNPTTNPVKISKSLPAPLLQTVLMSLMNSGHEYELVDAYKFRFIDI